MKCSDHRAGLFTVSLIIARPSSRDHRQLALRYYLPVHPHRAADVRHRPSLGQLFGLNPQFLSRSHGLEKLEVVDGREQGHPSIAFRRNLQRGRSQHHSRGLSYGFDQENTWQNGRGGKMASKNRVRWIDKLHRNTTNSRLQFFHPVDPQERRSMRNQRLDFTSLHHPGLDHSGLYTSKVSGGIFGFTELTSITKTLFTPLLPSISSDRGMKSLLPNFTTR